MPDIDALFMKLMDEKKAIYVASELGHDSTSIVERWYRDESVPGSKKFQVMTLLKEEGYL